MFAASMRNPAIAMPFSPVLLGPPLKMMLPVTGLVVTVIAELSSELGALVPCVLIAPIPAGVTCPAPAPPKVPLLFIVMLVLITPAGGDPLNADQLIFPDDITSVCVLS